LSILTKDAYRRLTSEQGFIIGGFSGFLLAVCCLGLVLFLLFRDRVYWIYILYLLGTLIALAMNTGFLGLPTLPRYPWVYHCAKALIWSLPILAGIAFTRSFLKTAIHTKRLDLVLKGFIRLYPVFLLVYPWIPPLTGRQLLNGALAATSLLSVTAAVICLKRGSAAAFYFLVSRLAIYLGAMVFSLVNMGFLPLNRITQNIYLLTLSFDIVFISMALGDNIRTMNRRIRGLVSDLRTEVRKRAMINQDLEKQMAERKRLEREIVKISDEERQHLGQELHDGLCQQLTAARLRFAAIEDRFTATDLKAEGTALSRLLAEAGQQAYRLSRGLWTTGATDTGAMLNLQDLVHRLSAQSDLAIELRQKHGCLFCTGKHLTQVHAIAQEAITNAIKHAQASRIEVRLECDPEGGIRLEVKDNGKGLNPQTGRENGMGIRIMKHRAEMIGGTLRIDDGEEGGVRLICRAPCRTDND